MQLNSQKLNQQFQDKSIRFSTNEPINTPQVCFNGFCWRSIVTLLFCKKCLVCSEIPCTKLLYQVETGQFICVADYFTVRNFCGTKFCDFAIFWQIRESLEPRNS